MTWAEALGYLASLLVIASLTQTRILWLRVLSLSGSVVFTVYAVLIDAVPIVITNVVLFTINLWHLWKILGGREEFSLLALDFDSAYLRRFLEFHADDIAASQPDFSGMREGDTVVMVLRDMVPTVVVVGRPSNGDFRVFLDYAIPSYRDFKGGKWLYERRADFFHQMDVDSIVATGLTRTQTRYLSRAGFRRRPDGKWTRRVGHPTNLPA
ncbi:MAG TPA: hypothetical protein VHL52_03870 [Acidimicrobiia bacterium]|nr:hypothetical protein [Acidimicrobiia bacterium]